MKRMAWMVGEDGMEKEVRVPDFRDMERMPELGLMVRETEYEMSEGEKAIVFGGG